MDAANPIATVATGRAVLVDRRQMMEVMEEQGYDDAGCTSEECAAEVGALLGVGCMINGAIGKLGDTYTIDVVSVTLVISVVR